MSVVSVIVPTYNRARMVVESVESVLAQSFSDFEVIVVDDGSTDTTREVISAFTDDRIHYIYQDNRGRSAARNRGIEASEGEYLAFLDSDDLFLPEKLEVQTATLDTRPEIGVVYSDGYFCDEEGRSLMRFSDFHPELGDGFVLDRIVRYNFIETATPLIRRTCFDRVGLFNEALVTHEDWEMWIRLAGHYRFHYVNVPLTRKRIHRTSVSADLVGMARGMARMHLEVESLTCFEQVSRQARRDFYRHWARSCLESGELRKGRENLLKAIRLDALGMKAYLMLGISLGGARFAQTLLLRYAERRLGDLVL